MTPIQVCALFVRVAGIFLAVATLRTLPALLANWNAYQRDSAGWVAYTILAMSGAAAACMIAFPQTVTRNIVGVRSDKPLTGNWSAGDVQSAAIAIMGLWIALQAAFDGAFWLIHRFVAFGILENSRTATSVPYSSDALASMLTAAVQFIAGCCLMLQAEGISNLLALARSAPRSTDDLTSVRGSDDIV